MVPHSPTQMNTTKCTFLSLETIRNIKVIQRISGIFLIILISLLQFKTCFSFYKNKPLYSFFKWKVQTLFYNGISWTKVLIVFNHSLLLYHFSFPSIILVSLFFSPSFTTFILRKLFSFHLPLALSDTPRRCKLVQQAGLLRLCYSGSALLQLFILRTLIVRIF